MKYCKRYTHLLKLRFLKVNFLYKNSKNKNFNVNNIRPTLHLEL